MKTLTVSVLVGVLSACTVGPNYRRPDIPISEQFRNAPAAHTIADSAWWQAFEDETLNNLIEQALQATMTLLKPWQDWSSNARIGVPDCIRLLGRVTASRTMKNKFSDILVALPTGN